METDNLPTPRAAPLDISMHDVAPIEIKALPNHHAPEHEEEPAQKKDSTLGATSVILAQEIIEIVSDPESEDGGDEGRRQ